MLNYRIAPADTSHIQPIAANMRAADRREVWASHRHTPFDALHYSLKHSERAWTAFIDEEPVLMWGVGRQGCILNDTGSPWLLGADGLKPGEKEFIRQSRRWVKLMQEGYERLENYVHAENRLSIRWLTWCGFEMSKEPTQFHGEDFYFFWRDADV